MWTSQDVILVPFDFILLAYLELFYQCVKVEFFSSQIVVCVKIRKLRTILSTLLELPEGLFEKLLPRIPLNFLRCLITTIIASNPSSSGGGACHTHEHLLMMESWCWRWRKRWCLVVELKRPDINIVPDLNGPWKYCGLEYWSQIQDVLWNGPYLSEACQG